MYHFVIFQTIWTWRTNIETPPLLHASHSWSCRKWLYEVIQTLGFWIKYGIKPKYVMFSCPNPYRYRQTDANDPVARDYFYCQGKMSNAQGT